MGLPAKLTPEEQLLLEKFAQRKKKTQGHAAQKNKQSEIKAVKVAKNEKKSKKDKLNVTLTSPVPVKPKDAKEVAKQLLAAGRLKINKSGAENRSFKRAKPVSEKRVRSSLTESAVENRTETPHKSPVKQENNNDPQPRFNQQSLRNNNLYVTGYGLKKSILESAFPPFGSVKNIHFESEKCYGYVTFQMPQDAEKAVQELHGSMVDGVTLRVTYARKRARNNDNHDRNWRPKNHNIDEPANSQRPSDAPPEMESRLPRLSEVSPMKNKPPEAKQKKRELVSYSEDFDF